ncbi:MAG: hypothetical protein E7208_03835 [Clostridium butyricum]|nr:hypothetical protein [Clostridium butyricum]
MNLLKETKEKLNYSANKLEELESLNIYELSKDAIHYVRDEISKSKKYIEYYSELLEVLEKNKENKK